VEINIYLRLFTTDNCHRCSILQDENQQKLF